MRTGWAGEGSSGVGVVRSELRRRGEEWADWAVADLSDGGEGDAAAACENGRRRWRAGDDGD